MMKKLFVAAGLLILLTTHPADAQSGGRGRSSYAGAGSNPDGRVLMLRRQYLYRGNIITANKAASDRYMRARRLSYR